MCKLPSNAKEVEDLRRNSAANPLLVFTFEELKVITNNFRPDQLLGGGGFGSVYKGFISADLRDGLLQPLQVAVKVHDGDNSYQGHREWLVNSSTLPINTLLLVYNFLLVSLMALSRLGQRVIVLCFQIIMDYIKMTNRWYDIIYEKLQTIFVTKEQSKTTFLLLLIRVKLVHSTP